MKFDKTQRKQDWPLEKVYQRKSLVMKEIAEINREMNRIDGIIGNMRNQKQIRMKKIANKWMYVRQLRQQIEETKLKENVGINET